MGRKRYGVLMKETVCYKPYGQTKAILDRSMQHIESVSYQVSVRWVFYRLLQEGYYSKKSDYSKFITLTSRARHGWYDGWTPATLADDTRVMSIYESRGWDNEPDIVELIKSEIEVAEENIEYYREQADNYKHNCLYEIDANYYQHNICIILFEARAMLQQFIQYTDGPTLCPFGGQPSIPYKWKIAKHI
jgi:hypothetical protein